MGRYQKIRPLKLSPQNRTIFLAYLLRELEILDETVDTMTAASRMEGAEWTQNQLKYYEHARQYLKSMASRFDPVVKAKAEKYRKLAQSAAEAASRLQEPK